MADTGCHYVTIGGVLLAESIAPYRVPEVGGWGSGAQEFDVRKNVAEFITLNFHFKLAN